MIPNFLRCIKCGKNYPSDEIRYRCSCGGLLEVCYEELKARKEDFMGSGVWRYDKLLPVECKVTLKEGGTGLYQCMNLDLGVDLWVKNEGDNPTGSFKDRGMTVGVSKAISLGLDKAACASTGNTSASLSAYCARAGMTTYVFIPSGKIAYGKLSQAMIHGAKIYAMEGDFDLALEMVEDFCARHGVYWLNSINPFRLEGQKTIGYEIIEQLNYRAPDYIVLPVGNAGNISALWKGLLEFQKLGLLDELPKLVGVQAEGASPIVRAIDDGIFSPVERPETIATAIRIGNPVSAEKAIRAIKESKGMALAVSDEEIIKAQSALAQREGLFVEPASASSIAGLAKCVENGWIEGGASVVCITTGHGLKDPDVVVNRLKDGIVEIEKVIEIEIDM
jgi:threonine synthase